MQADLVLRLLMYGDTDGAPADDIPLGQVNGLWSEFEEGMPGDVPLEIWQTGLAPVGLGSISRQPSHE